MACATAWQPAQHIARGEDSLFSVLWGFAKLFGWWHWTDDQEAGVLAAYAALTVVLASITRGKVTPV